MYPLYVMYPSIYPMYPSINLRELKQDINSKGHTATKKWNVRRRITKESLPMLFVETSNK